MSSFLKLDLSEIFNHKTILEDLSQIGKTGFVNQGLDSGQFFRDSSCPESLKELEVRGVPFVFPDKSIDKYDTIECEGQYIQIPEGIYDSVHIIGFSIFSDTIEKIKLNFGDASSWEFDAGFIDWWQSVNRKDEGLGYSFGNRHLSSGYEVAFKCKTLEDVSVGTTYISNRIEREKKLIGMELPFNPSVHIFSITLQSARETRL